MSQSIRPLIVGAVALLTVACRDVAPPAASTTAARLLTPATAATNQVIPNEYIVVLKPGVTDVAGEAALARALGGTVRAEWQHALHGYWAVLPAPALNALLSNPNVDWIEPNGTATIVGQEICPAGYANCSWGIDRIDQLSSSLDLTYNYPSNTASTVHAYIIDTGMRITHQEFGTRASYGYDFIDNDAIADDCHGHGTHVGGTIGGTTYGVAKGVSLVAVRVLDCTGSGSWGTVISGIDWVTAHAIKPAVANMSLGGALNTSVNTAVGNSVAAGIVYAVAAGNSSADACQYSPSSTASALTVGATGAGSGIPPTPIDTRASYSNYGTCLDVFAPGSYITSAWNTSNSATATLSGTSMASPHVAGVAALYLAQNPTATPSQVASALVNSATSGVVASAGTGSPNKLLYSGFLNGGAPPPSNQPPVARYTISCIPGSCTLDASTSSDDVGIASYAWVPGTSGRNAKTGVKVTYIYIANEPNSFDVTLTVTDGGGLTSSVTQLVTIPSSTNQAPVASFVITCVPGSCTLDGTSSTDDHGVVSYSWVSSDPARANGSGAIITQSSFVGGLSSYQETLTVTDGGGLTNSVTKTVTIPNAPPVASITSPLNNATFTQGQSISFQGSATDAEQGTISGAALVWRSSINGQIGTGGSFSTSALSVGTHVITLTATDNAGATGTAQIGVVVSGSIDQPPVANFTVTCIPKLCTLDGTASTDDHGIVSYAWQPNVAGRNAKTGSIISYMYISNEPNSFTVTLTVTDTNGQTNAVTKQVTITP